MKRFHAHIRVDDLASSVRFYSTLFGTEPAVLKADYAKWMLDDPRVNFAISTRGRQPGLDHLGIQAENEDELNEVYTRLSKAERPVIEENATTCCYARSDKQWITDPTGRILGLMPHPERHLLSIQHPRKNESKFSLEGDGLQIFKNGVKYVKAHF